MRHAGNPLFAAEPAAAKGSASPNVPMPATPVAVLVDETSMLDMPMAAALLDALPSQQPLQLVLVGQRSHTPSAIRPSGASSPIRSPMHAPMTWFSCPCAPLLL